MKINWKKIYSVVNILSLIGLILSPMVLLSISLCYVIVVDANLLNAFGLKIDGSSASMCFIIPALIFMNCYTAFKYTYKYTIEDYNRSIDKAVQYNLFDKNVASKNRVEVLDWQLKDKERQLEMKKKAKESESKQEMLNKKIQEIEGQVDERIN